MSEATKACSKCKLKKPLHDFSPNNKNKDGVTGHCKDCLNEYRRGRRKKLLCARCGKQLSERKSLCQECRVFWNRHRDQKIAAGLCEICSEPITSGGRCCDRCIEKRKKRRAKVIAAGICSRCRKNKADAGMDCSGCWFKHAAKRHLGSVRHLALIMRLWAAQDGVCALSGVTLIPGVNASLDHVVPRSKGGKNEAGNLRWVDRRVNRARDNMSDVELFTMCKRIVACIRSKKHRRGTATAQIPLIQ